MFYFSYMLAPHFLKRQLISFNHQSLLQDYFLATILALVLGRRALILRGGSILFLLNDRVALLLLTVRIVTYLRQALVYDQLQILKQLLARVH